MLEVFVLVPQPLLPQRPTVADGVPMQFETAPRTHVLLGAQSDAEFQRPSPEAQALSYG